MFVPNHRKTRGCLFILGDGKVNFFPRLGTRYWATELSLQTPLYLSLFIQKMRIIGSVFFNLLLNEIRLLKALNLLDNPDTNTASKITGITMYYFLQAQPQGKHF